MRIELPELCVVAMIGVSGSGKTTFANTHFKPTEVLSSDFFRGMLSDDENNQLISKDAFETLYYVADKRLSLGKLTVIDATNVQREARARVLELAREQNCQAAAIVLNIPPKVCAERNEQRPDRSFGDHVVKKQSDLLRRSLKYLKKEGFRFVYVVDEEEANNVEIVRQPLWSNKKTEKGPFDIIGDVHGCYDELCALLTKLGYQVDTTARTAFHPDGRKAVFVGDLCDRGPKNMDVLHLVMNMTEAGHGFSVVGNHDAKLLRKLNGSNIKLTHGFDLTAEQLEAETEESKERIRKFLTSMISHYLLDGGRLAVAHAGIIEKYQGRASGRVKSFCLFGETTGETDEYGMPVRIQWANDYRGRALVVYGHTPSVEVTRINNTICVDTGCVFGGKLTAYRYPEDLLIDVPAGREYYKPARPLDHKTEEYHDMLNIEDVTGERYLSSRLRRSIKVKEENSIAALEVMSRFAVDPHWLIYLPPTMSPCETSSLPEYLEHPEEAFRYYQSHGINQVVCEQKHMGSRAVFIVCRDEAAARKRFGSLDGRSGIIYTRTGRHFFDQAETEQALLQRLGKILTATGFWEDYQTDWVCLDTELMPWSAKAQKLLEEQYAGVGRSGRNGLTEAVRQLTLGASRQHRSELANTSQSNQNADLSEILTAFEEKLEAMELYTKSYRQYCWNVESIEDYRVAPFHILATEGKVWNGTCHQQQMEIIKKYMTGADPIFMATPYKVVNLDEPNDIAAGIAWWESLTETGGEGMVVKPSDFIAMEGNELLQPAVKCRGREYLRIIYGPEYTIGDHLTRLKKRSLKRKRNLALCEFSLGMESLERFIRKEPLHRVHECVFGVLALESEPVDPRL